jgi:AraC family transcriptional regulator of adaptative response / DNA-3-methyladenine glycosylase II
MKGVECIEGGAYSRSVRLAGRTGWVRVRHAPEKHSLFAEVTHSLTPVLPALLGRLRNMFDLGARPDIISAHLGVDPFLGDSVRENPGLRVPGAFDGFELAVRAILGQQISVKAATTLAGRFAEAFGDPFATSRDEIRRLAPTPERVAASRPEELTALGILESRAASIIALSRAVNDGRLSLEAGAAVDETIGALTALPGIGAWTAHYIGMRALRWPDAFPKEDVVVRKMLGGVTAMRADAMSQPWRPWRSYATLHLWRAASAS